MRALPQLPGFRLLARTATRDCPIALHQRGRRYVITSCRHVLMSNEDTGSERALGRIAARLLRRVANPRVLVGGLGMGFTLRMLLNHLPARARIVVSELLPAVARWNRDRLGHLADHPIEDSRVDLRLGDVAHLLPGRPVWDAIVLDIDNGPEWLVQRRNGALYGRRGVLRLVRSLRHGGFIAVWSANRHPAFEDRIARMGLRLRRFRASFSQDSTGPLIYVVQPARSQLRRGLG